MRLIFGFVVASFLLPLPARAADQLIAVDVGLADITINKIPYLMAADYGLYEKNGLAVRQFISPAAAELARQSGVEVPPELVQDDDSATPIITGGGSPNIYLAVYEGAPDRVILASLETVLRSQIIARPEFETMEDLRGARFGYSRLGRANHIGALSFARAVGWTPGTDFTLVGDASTIRALTEDRADATVAGGVPVAMAPEAGLNIVLDLGQYNIPFAGSGINVERNWLNANRDAAARFVKSSVEAIALLKRDRATFDATVAKWMNITDSAVSDRMYAEALEFPAKPYPGVDGIRTITEIYDTPEMRARTVEDFYDSSFVEELDSSGFIDALYQ